MSAHTCHERSIPATLCCVGAAVIFTSFPTKAPAQETLEEIVVTARKRDESLQDAPVSITAFTSSDLAMRGAFDVSDLFGSVPNVTSTNGLQIRGIGYNARNIGIEGGATVYVDGVYTGRPFTFNQSLIDTRSMEVLRGPQGTLFGKNSIAGVINIRTQDPTFDEFSGHGLASFGNDSKRRVQLSLNVPVSDRAALRVGLDHDDDGGYYRNLYSNRDFFSSRNNGGRAAFRWAASEAIDVTFRGNYFRSRGEPRAAGETLLGVDPQTPPPRVVNAPGRLTTTEDSPTDATIVLQGGSATLEYRMSPAFTLTSVTGYEENSSDLNEGEDDSALNKIEVQFFNRQKQFTQEFRGTGTVGKFNYVAGLFYFHQNSFQENRGILGTDFAIPPLGIPGGVKKAIDPKGTIVTQSHAAFADVTYALTEALELELGGRVNREDKDFSFGVTTDAPALFYVVAPDTDSFSDTDFSPTAGVRYHFSERMMGYLRYAKGYKSGGWNADFASTVPGKPAPTVQSLRFDAENATTYELGFKTGFLNGGATLNAAFFYTNFQNLQVAQFNGINLEAGGELSVTSNAGKATIKGVELEGSWLPVKELQFSAGVGYQDAVYDRFDNAGGAGVSAAGKQFANVPHWTGNLTGQYGYALADGATLHLRSDFSYTSDRFGDVLNSPVREEPSYWVGNARIGYAAPEERWQLYLWSNNFTAHNYIRATGVQQFAIVQSQPVRTVNYGRPITYGLEFQANF